MTLSLISYTKTELGLVRTNNEDAYYSCDLHGTNEHTSAECRLYVVADGMGGVAAGEVASRIAVESIVRACRGAGRLQNGVEAQELMVRAFQEANDDIRRYVRQNPGDLGMGTTMTALLFRDDEAVLAHVGDSRAYLLRESELYQVSKDHSEVQLLVDLGRLTSVEARDHPRKHILTQAVGVDIALNVFTRKLSILSGDVFALCSDGLTDMVSDEEIRDLLRARREPEAAAQGLIEAAMAAGGRDNVTVIVIKVLG